MDFTKETLLELLYRGWKSSTSIFEVSLPYDFMR